MDNMSEISAIPATNVVSLFTRVHNVGPNEVITHIKHNQQDGGPIKVSEISYKTYNALGELGPNHKAAAYLDAIV